MKFFQIFQLGRYTVRYLRYNNEGGKIDSILGFVSGVQQNSLR